MKREATMTYGEFYCDVPGCEHKAQNIKCPACGADLCGHHLQVHTPGSGTCPLCTDDARNLLVKIKVAQRVVNDLKDQQRVLQKTLRTERDG